jgi:hypothetical protein
LLDNLSYFSIKLKTWLVHGLDQAIYCSIRLQTKGSKYGTTRYFAWREINQSNGYSIKIYPRLNPGPELNNTFKTNSLFFVNLGGYKEAEFEEFHYKFLVVAPNRAIASQKAKQTAFYKHFGFTGATSHIDDKYGIDIDDIHEIEDILPNLIKVKFSIETEWIGSIVEDHLNLGYLRLDKID